MNVGAALELCILLGGRICCQAAACVCNSFPFTVGKVHAGFLNIIRGRL